MRIVKRKQIVFTLLALLLVSLVAGCGRQLGGRVRTCTNAHSHSSG